MESLYDTVEVTAVPPGPVRVMVDAVTVVGSRERENAIVIDGDRGTWLAPLAGLVETTLGGGSVPLATEKFHVYGVPSSA